MSCETLCPVHEHARRDCDDDCLPARQALHRLSHAYRVYWWDRRRGTRPMPLAEYRARYHERPVLLPRPATDACGTCGESEPCACEQARSFVRIASTRERLSR